MARRGYSGEYRVKQKLKTMYDGCTIIKTAIGQDAPDYLVLKPMFITEYDAMKGFRACFGWGVHLVKGVEVKSTKKTKYYPKRHDIKQWGVFKDLIDGGIPVEYWVLTKKEGMVNCQMMGHHDFGKKYIKGGLI